MGNFTTCVNCKWLYFTEDKAHCTRLPPTLICKEADIDPNGEFVYALLVAYPIVDLLTRRCGEWKHYNGQESEFDEPRYRPLLSTADDDYEDPEA